MILTIQYLPWHNHLIVGNQKHGNLHTVISLLINIAFEKFYVYFSWLPTSDMQDESEDYIKRQQLRELAMLNSNFREESPGPSGSVSPFNSSGMKRAKTGRWKKGFLVTCRWVLWFSSTSQSKQLWKNRLTIIAGRFTSPLSYIFLLKQQESKLERSLEEKDDLKKKII